MRSGSYEDLDKSKMTTAEFATVTANDPNTIDGKSLYIALGNSVVKRLMTDEDLNTRVLTNFENTELEWFSIDVSTGKNSYVDYKFASYNQVNVITAINGNLNIHKSIYVKSFSNIAPNIVRFNLSNKVEYESSPIRITGLLIGTNPPLT